MGHAMPPEIMEQIRQEDWDEPRIKAAVSAQRLRLMIARDYGLLSPPEAAAALAHADQVGEAAMRERQMGGGGGIALSRLFEDVRINKICDRVTKALVDTIQETEG